MRNAVSCTPHKALSSGLSLYIRKFISISVGRDLSQCGAPAFMTHKIFVVFLTTPAPGLR